MKFTLSLILALGLAGGAMAETKRPNIVLFMADDLSDKNLSCYGATNFKTPILDKLAATGMRFTEAYALSVCTPSRVALMSGMHNGRNFLHTGHLEANQYAFAEAFQAAGFKTCVVGKWKLSRAPKGATKEEKAVFQTSPYNFGFDEYFITEAQVSHDRYKNPTVGVNGKIKTYTDGEFGPDLVNAYALNFLEQNKDKPFLLYYPMVLVHAPIVPMPGDPRYADAPPGKEETNMKNPQVHEDYKMMVSYMDKMVGNVIDKLDKLGLRENTLVIFTADNGTKKGFEMELASGDTYPGGKGESNNTGLNVPLIINQPGTVPVGTSDALVDLPDMFPTIAEASGITIPSSLRLDGRSFLPTAHGKPSPNERAAIYHWLKNTPDQPGPIKEYAFDKRYRLHKNGGFFDTDKDVLETTPLDLNALTAAEKGSYELLKAELERHALVPLQALEVPTEMALKAGEEQQLEVKRVPVDATQDSMWFTSDSPKVVKVDKLGVMHALQAGAAVITVESIDRALSRTVNVSVQP